VSATAAIARRLIAQATGPSAVTIWTWLVTLPFALTVMSGLQYVTGGPVEVVAVASVEHVGVGLLLLALRLLLVVVPGSARAATVITGFAVIGVLRPLLFLVAGALLHIPVAPGDLGGRILINVVTTVAMFSLIAVAVQLVRDHAGVYRRLRAAQEASARDAERAAAQMQQLRHSAVDAVMERLEQATSEAAIQPIHPAAAAKLLRGLAEEVVRPASHRIYEEPIVSAAEGALEDAADVGVVHPREWIASVFGAMQAAPPLPLAVLFAVLVLPFGVWQYGVLFMLTPLVCGFAVLVAGNAAMVPLVHSTPPVLRFFVLLVGYAVVGVLLSATSVLVVRLLGGDPRLVWFEAATYWVVGFAVAFVASLTARVRRDQSELEAAIQSNIRAAATTRTALEHERRALARLLHSGVQSELIAAALALGSGSGEDASADLRGVVDNIRAELRAPRVEPEAADRIAALVESWGSAIALRSSIGDVWERLREPGRAEAVVDAISEGLANAVRHGDGTTVTLEVTPAAAHGVAVLVVSGGVLSSARPGIGLRQLAEHGDVALRENAGRVELAVAIR
jgi:signal transduction histidine kinase